MTDQNKNIVGRVHSSRNTVTLRSVGRFENNKPVFVVEDISEWTTVTNVDSLLDDLNPPRTRSNFQLCTFHSPAVIQIMDFPGDHEHEMTSFAVDLKNRSLVIPVAERLGIISFDEALPMFEFLTTSRLSSERVQLGPSQFGTALSELVSTKPIRWKM